MKRAGRIIVLLAAVVAALQAALFAGDTFFGFTDEWAVGVHFMHPQLRQPAARVILSSEDRYWYVSAVETSYGPGHYPDHPRHWFAVYRLTPAYRGGAGPADFLANGDLVGDGNGFLHWEGTYITGGIFSPIYRGGVWAIPRSYAATVTTIPPAILLILIPTLRALRGRRLRFAGRCVACGYDLRATPERCPECGAVPAPARKAEAPAA